MAFTAKRVKLLTRPVLKLEQDVTRYIKVVAPMYIGRDIKKSRNADPNEKKKEPATIIDVTDLESGEAAQIVANTVLKSTLAEEYPGDGYVGKCFAITKQAKQPGRDYNKFKIEEIEDPAASESSTGEAQPAAATPISSHAGGAKRR